MMLPYPEFRASRNSNRMCIEFDLFSRETGKRLKVVSYEETDLQPYQDMGEPALRMREEEAQKLLEDLWNCGLRPQGWTGSVGEVQKVENHLKDLRTIAFKALKIENPLDKD
jgi:hypothetical protein